jgi:hypothetical protein
VAQPVPRRRSSRRGPGGRGLDARHLFDGDDGWHIAILDPEGNEFCIQ